MNLSGRSPNLTVEGIHYASASQVRHVFAKDFGRSLYLVPIQKRREAATGDRLGGGRDGFQGVAGHGEGAHSRAQPVAFVRLLRPRRRTECRASR